MKRTRARGRRIRVRLFIGHSTPDNGQMCVLRLSTLLFLTDTDFVFQRAVPVFFFSEGTSFPLQHEHPSKSRLRSVSWNATAFDDEWAGRWSMRTRIQLGRAALAIVLLASAVRVSADQPSA